MRLSNHNIKFWAATDVGKVRDHNEDNFLIDKNLNLFIVADGMGGHAAGEVASAMAVKEVRDVVHQNKDLLERFEGGDPAVARKDVLNLLEHAIQSTCHSINLAATLDKQKKGMGTTLSVLLVMGNRGFIAHVGDSRIYLLRQSQVVQLTEDHSLINELIKRGKLTREQAETSPYKNAVTRAVGVYESVEVDTLDFDVLPGDQFLIASDGLTGYLKDNEIPPLLTHEEVKEVPGLFINLANERGGKDNITNIVVRLEDVGEAGDLKAEVNLKIETLQKMPVFKYLSFHELMHVMNITTIRVFPVGEPMLVEGKVGDELFILLSGGARIEKGGTAIAVLGPGAHVGEMALIDSAPRSASVTAIAETKALAIRRPDFFKMIRNEPVLATKLLWNFLQVLTDRLRTTSEELSGARNPETAACLTEELFAGDDDEASA